MPRMVGVRAHFFSFDVVAVLAVVKTPVTRRATDETCEC